MPFTRLSGLHWHRPAFHPCSSIGQWDHRFHSPCLEGVTHVVAADPEHVYVAGRVDLIGVGAVGIARWDGNSWHALGSGLEGDVHVMTISPSGMLYVGGDIQRAGDASGANIVKWNGSTWEPVANYSDHITKIAAMTGVYSMVFGSGDTLYAVGNRGNDWNPFFAVWDGSAWSTEDLGISVRTPGFNDETLYGIGDHVMVYGLDGWVEEASLPDDPRGLCWRSSSTTILQSR